MVFNNSSVYVSPRSKIGKNVRIGNNTVIHDNAKIEGNSVIRNGCSLGEPLVAYYLDRSYEKGPPMETAFRS
jgi:UDP-3-O-[3-hydroxymyristoyl] glucosamine N-acyltransferase